MDQEKIQAFNDQQKALADERAKTEDMALAVNLILSSQEEVKEAIGQTLQGVVKFLGQYKPEVSISNPQEIPDIKPVVDSVTGLIQESSKSNADFTKVVAGLNKVNTTLSKLPTEYPETKIPEPINYTKQLLAIEKAAGTAPVFSIPKTEVNIPDYSKELKSLQKAVEGIKIPPVPKTDFSSVEKAVKEVKETIKNLRFPVANYVLPFKDINGAATQVQLDADGNLPIPSSGGGTQYQEDTGHTTGDTGTLTLAVRNDAQIARTSANSDYSSIAVDDVGRPIVASAAYSTRIDEASGTVTYLGNALCGTATSAAAWQIKKIDSSSGVAITFADGDPQFNNVWSDRASLTYS